jgi:hypothetical protein
MIFIRRAVDKHKAYTVIMLPGEPTKWIPTTDYEHQRILEIFKQDKYYEGIENDFTELKKKTTLFRYIKDISFEKYKQTRIKLNVEFLRSALDKEKYRSIIKQ